MGVIYVTLSEKVNESTVIDSYQIKAETMGIQTKKQIGRAHV